MKKKVSLFLDCGEFSAWRRGTTIDLPKYVEYLKEVKDYLFAYASIDKIPGTFGAPRTQKEVEESAKIGYDNLQKIKEAGLSPIPIFHQGEKFYWLERLLKDGEPYIGISSAKDLWANEQRKWLDDVFTLLTDSKGAPLVRTHGFGITRPAFIFRYPFYSCDSTAWSLAPGYGAILLPPFINGKPDYLRQPIKIVLSGVQHTSPSSQKKQFEGLGPEVQKWVTKFLEEVVGVSVAEARYGTAIRRRAMLIYYQNLANALTNVKFKYRRANSLFGGFNTLDVKPTKFDHLHIMFATAMFNRAWSTEMNSLNCTDRLVSYWELKDRSPDLLKQYVKNGIDGAYNKKPPKQSWRSESYRNYRRLSLLERLKEPAE